MTQFGESRTHYVPNDKRMRYVISYSYPTLCAGGNLPGNHNGNILAGLATVPRHTTLAVDGEVEQFRVETFPKKLDYIQKKYFLIHFIIPVA